MEVEEQLIKSVKKYPCLWKPDIPEFRDSEIKDAAWADIVKECNFQNVTEAKSLWKKLRRGHRLALNKRSLMQRQVMYGEINIWKHEQSMDFLLPHVRNKQQIANIFPVQYNTNLPKDNVPQIKMQENTNFDLNKHHQMPFTPLTNKLQYNRMTGYLENEQRIQENKLAERDLFQEYLVKREHFQLNEKNGLKNFFDSMGDMTNNLPKYLQMKVQRQVFNIVMEAREEKLQNEYLCPSTTFDILNTIPLVQSTPNFLNSGMTGNQVSEVIDITSD